MPANITNIVFEPGAMILHRSSGPPTRYPIVDVIRALDIPTGITYTQVPSITTLANLVVIIIRVLIDRDILDEQFADSLNMNLSLDEIIKVIEAMGGAYHEPDLDDVDN